MAITQPTYDEILRLFQESDFLVKLQPPGAEG
jgi:hypothetical protein